MHTRSKLALISALSLTLVLGTGVRGDYVVKKDGTVLEGTVLKKSDGLWVKGKDGESQTVPLDQVKEQGKGAYKGPGAAKPDKAAGGSAKPKAGEKDKPAADAKDAAGGAKGKKVKVGDYAATERRANQVTAAMAAVTIWQEFIDSKPPAEELKKAKAEMKKWDELAKGKGEKIKGKWVAGEEREAIVGKGLALYKQGFELMDGQQTLQALEKFKESVSVYPNNFHANFFLGYLSMIQHKTPDAKKYFELAQKIRPNSPEVIANLALLEVDKRQHVKAIEMLLKAARMGDNKAIVQNLMAAISTAPRGAANNSKVKAAIEDARLLAARYGVGGGGGQFVIVPLGKEGDGAAPGGEDDPLVGGLSSGTGFLISKDGLILTNRHVVEDGKTLMVLINDKERRSAEVVVIDTEQDLALIRVKPDEGEDLPIVQLAPTDAPGDGAGCTVMGYPMRDRLGGSIKVTTGVVSSGNNGSPLLMPDVTIDATVNPGNSGGPILDKHGNVIAIVSMKTVAQSGVENTYGLAISTGRIRKFLAKNKVELKAAEVSADAVALDTEQVASKVKPATVCILATH
jgi:S1-C subfamily serine protease